MTDAPPFPYLAVDDAARALARRLLRTARHAAFGWLEPDTGAPMASRVALATDFDGSPILLLSRLSAHTRALTVDARLSLLVGEPSAGDPLTQPRLSLAGVASSPVARDAPERERLARRFTAHHPSAAQYGTFADFAFYRVELASAFLNAGFARAYPLASSDLVERDAQVMAPVEPRVVEHMNADHADIVDQLMVRQGAAAANWRIATLDRRGFEAVSGPFVERIEFAEPVTEAAGFRAAFVALAHTLED